MTARILVVDDVEVNVRLLEAKLQAEYFTVLAAYDGFTALRIAQEERPDIILLDVMMPRLDGFETCRRLKADERTQDIPVVMVTALSEAADRVRGLESGADDFLTKPVNDTALFARVRSLVRLRRTMEEWRHREDVCGRFSRLVENDRPASAELPPRMLVWEESPLAANRLAEMLNPLAGDLMRVGAPEDLVPACDAGIDLVILSTAGKVDALRILSKLRAKDASRGVPVLLIGDPDELPRVAKGLDLGASDYLMRPLDRNELLARVRTQIRRKRLQDSLHENYQRSLSLALTDGLTGLYNRRYLSVHLDGLLERATENGTGPSLLMLDIDWFKRVNDTYGHATGDAVLREVTTRMSRHVRPFDLFARYGGEEFVVVLPETPQRVAEAVAERLRMVVAEQPMEISDPPTRVSLTISIGLAVTEDAHETSASLLRRADAALYAAKAAGRNCVVSYTRDLQAPAGAVA
jgi:two-component system, cell cycle response regulator